MNWRSLPVREVMHRQCVLKPAPCTESKGVAKNPEADLVGAVVSEAAVCRRQRKKEETCEYEVKCQINLADV